MSDPTCEDRVEDRLESRLSDLRLLWSAYSQEDCKTCDGSGEVEPELDDLNVAEDEDTIEDCIDCQGTGKAGDEDGNVLSDYLGNIYEYGLDFGYVAPETFNDQPEGYFRYQLSYGGPSDEFRIYAQKVNEYSFSTYRIEYWFLDWFDGAHRTLTGENLEFLKEIFSSFFVDSGTADHQLQAAMEAV